MGLKDALRLKSFKVPKFEIRVSKMKGGKPYLEVVNEVLYQIRDPTPVDGQGGSGSNPPERIVNVSPIRSASVVISDKGKTIGTGGGQVFQEGGSAGKVVLYRSEHLSIEDEGLLDERVATTFQLKVSLKRHHKQTSKADSSPQQLKRPKSVSVFCQEVIVEDERDRGLDFSASVGLLENLATHLTEGKLS
ncbi:hypothetical protein HanXRQr2_Chr05g0212351 [Helianthus annuus]|uniref:Uncharacterized protein n=1 Tax=Helianthus annuus TaxID=4232 RepID=A0A9K3IZB8_HELAN|nr:hypothetical protein HanXRQr2_Chr05g0212351 [Helianthus annuus]KAJ0570076.1 hypothetical protein HanHA300_Chr05g0173981 [Helianthus annuus]KAJ0576803.1 hypothetical protein HanIR_Chr05g0228651 [Helianthus annuus]KAJ0584406.1 hypothetical protein HanHA89_Chr05g0188271 [Helianthus annuus]KAJ0747033.1 hypothetical protein HanOQP8_Chr05g0184831 [Helianthus annuus]